MAQIGADCFLQTSRLERETVFTWQVKQQIDGFLRKTLSSAASVKSADEFNCGNKVYPPEIFEIVDDQSSGATPGLARGTRSLPVSTSVFGFNVRCFPFCDHPATRAPV
jgi:hypothetical protein